MATCIRTGLLAMLLLGTPVALFGQQSGQSTPPPDSNATSGAASAKPDATPSNKKQNQTTKNVPNAPSRQTPAAAKDNAFPAAQSEAAAKAKAAAAKPTATSPSDKNTFPEAQSEAAARANTQNAPPVSKQPLKLLPPSGVSSSNADLPPEDLGETTKKHERLDSFTKDLNPAGRVEDDLEVADLYMKNWNYRGAYLRYKDALQFDASNETALFGVAQASCMQNMTGEALAQFKTYLQQYPRGDHAKEAEKMLRDPTRCAAHR